MCKGCFWKGFELLLTKWNVPHCKDAAVCTPGTHRCPCAGLCGAPACFSCSERASARSPAYGWSAHPLPACGSAGLWGEEGRWDVTRQINVMNCKRLCMKRESGSNNKWYCRGTQHQSLSNTRLGVQLGNQRNIVISTPLYYRILTCTGWNEQYYTRTISGQEKGPWLTCSEWTDSHHSMNKPHLWVCRFTNRSFHIVIKSEGQLVKLLYKMNSGNEWIHLGHLMLHQKK